MRDNYNKLLKIKKPVLIEVYSNFTSNEVIKYRILYPSGKCEYVFVDSDVSFFKSSCFSTSSLKSTVKLMKDWDKDISRKIKIKEI